MVVAGNIIADEVGLYRRSARGRHHIVWEDVTGYYDQRKPGSDRGTEFAIAEWQRVVTMRGRTLTFDEGSYKNERQLRAWIQQHATSASTRLWGEMRRSPEDWPGVFHYNTTINRNSLRWLHQGHWLGLAAVIVYFAWQWQTTHTLPGWEWLITPTGLFFVGKQVFLLALYPSSRRTEPYLQRKIRADADGLIFTDGTGRERIAWGEITDFYQDGFRSVVVTGKGKWDFLGTLTGFEGLKRIIRRYAVNAGPTEWRRRSPREQRDTSWYLSK